MNIQERPVDWSLQKFGVGQPVPRTEDPRLVRGEGRYTDDVNLPGDFAPSVRQSAFRVYGFRLSLRSAGMTSILNSS